MIPPRFNLIKYFNRFDGHGNGLIIKGRVRSGKTYLVSLFIRLLLMAGFCVISNVRFKNEVYIKYKNRLFYISTDKEYFEAYLKIKPGSKIVMVWDDAQSKEGFTSTGVMTKEGKKLSAFLIFIGKFETSYIYIAHKSYIPKSITEGFEPLILYKFKRNSFILSDTIHENDRDVFKDKNAVFFPIPKGDILPIQSRAVASFEFKLDLEKMYSFISQFEYGEDLRRGVKEYLAKHGEETEFSELKDLSYGKIYMAMCMKKGKILSSGSKFSDLINSSLINEARKKLKKMGYK